MAQRTGSLRVIKIITVLALVTVLLSASIRSLASMRFDALPTFFNLGYASIDTSDSEVKQENKAESEENKAHTNGDEESSDSNSQEQQTECSNMKH